MMRALRYEQAAVHFEAGRIERIGIPEHGPNDVLIRIEAAELKAASSRTASGVRGSRQRYPGTWIAGVVDRVGDNVIGLESGERIAAIGSEGVYAEYGVVHVDRCYPIPDDMAYTEAAALGLDYQIAHFALIERAGFQTGERVFIGGAAGDVGCAAMQLVNAMDGVSIAGGRSREEAAAALNHGADEVVDLSAITDVSVSGPQGAAIESQSADIVLDLLGGAMFGVGLDALKSHGRLVVTGAGTNGLSMLGDNIGDIVFKNISIHGLCWIDYFERYPQRVSAAQQHMYGLYQSGRLNPHIKATYSLNEFDRAMASARSTDSCGKTLLTL